MDGLEQSEVIDADLINSNFVQQFVDNIPAINATWWKQSRF